MLTLLAYISIAVGAHASYNNIEPVDSFPLPAVPAALTVPTERAEYVVSHFFDGAILPDSPSLGLETMIANFTTVAPLASEDAIHHAAATLYSRADNDDKLETVRTVLEQYLFSSDSPFLDLDLFTLFLEADKPSMRRDGLLNLSSLNRKGSQASDINILTSVGTVTSLKQLASDSAAILLVFFDPECERCIEFTSDLAKDPQLKGAIKNKQLSVVTIWPGGNQPVKPIFFPEEWITGTDAEGMIEESDLYFIPSFPDAYLLTGKDLTVKSRGLHTLESVRKELGL